MITDGRARLDGAAGAIEAAGKVALFCHVAPDGDTLGSALALRLALMQRGKACDVYSADGIPAKYMFLPEAAFVRQTACDMAAYDLAIAVDAADASRLGAYAEGFLAAKATVVIDHHPTNPAFGRINVIEPDAASTAEVMLRVIEAIGAPLTKRIALCLFVGVSTDTNQFSYNNVSADTLRMAARLVETGIDLNAVTGMLYRYRTAAQTKLIGQCIGNMRISCGDAVAVMKSTFAQRDACGAGDEDYEGIINYAIEIDSVSAAALLRTVEDENVVKASFRSKGCCDVGALAASHGGGGHKNASGCTLHMDIERAASLVEAELCALVEGRG